MGVCFAGIKQFGGIFNNLNRSIVAASALSSCYGSSFPPCKIHLSHVLFSKIVCSLGPYVALIMTYIDQTLMTHFITNFQKHPSSHMQKCCSLTAFNIVHYIIIPKLIAPDYQLGVRDITGISRFRSPERRIAICF